MPNIGIQFDYLVTETVTKFPMKNIEEYTNKKIRNFLALTSKDKIQIKYNYNPENTGIIKNFLNKSL
jgi:hypothetical protein